VGGPVAPPGVEIAPWRPEFSEDARMMRNEAFRDHWGSSDVAPEDWAHFMAVAAFRPDYSFVAFANGEPAGFIIAQEYAEPGTAGRDLYIATVGTRAAHRKRGVASALLTRALSGAKAAGFAQASLDVDADSPTGALGLYTSLGFVRVHTYVMLKKSPL
ncbi:MAG TPA: GNAT family N-acetyltransferase, partial [Acidimicrobiales bacterium]|nr:GNAT family N-acetyltransferase [Acidimicrobiales bacterium]